MIGMHGVSSYSLLRAVRTSDSNLVVVACIAVAGVANGRADGRAVGRSDCLYTDGRDRQIETVRPKKVRAIGVGFTNANMLTEDQIEQQFNAIMASQEYLQSWMSTEKKPCAVE